MLSKLAGCYENMLTASNQLATAQRMLDALVEAVDDVDSGDFTTAGETKGVPGQSKLNSVQHGLAGAFAALRSALRDSTAWDQFANSGPMSESTTKSLGRHWVCRHAATVLENCADLVEIYRTSIPKPLEQEILNLQLQLAECEEREGASEFSGDHKEQRPCTPSSSA